MAHELVVDEHGQYFRQDPRTNLYVKTPPFLLSTGDSVTPFESEEIAGTDRASGHQNDNGSIPKTQWTVSSVGDLSDNNRILDLDDQSDASATHDPKVTTKAGTLQAQGSPAMSEAILTSQRIYPTVESIPPIQKTGNPFEHHADGGDAWMDKAFEEGIRDPEIIEFDDSRSKSSRCSPPAETTIPHDEGSRPPPSKKQKQHDSPQSPAEKIPLSQEQRDHKALHDKAKAFRPSHSLKDGRYWIGVVKLDLAPNKVKEKGDILWFKGNKKTCVKTIWHKFREHNVSLVDFRLQLRDEFPESFDIMEGLDFYADKQIVFRSCTFVELDE